MKKNFLCGLLVLISGLVIIHHSNKTPLKSAEELLNERYLQKSKAKSGDRPWAGYAKDYQIYQWDMVKPASGKPLPTNYLIEKNKELVAYDKKMKSKLKQVERSWTNLGQQGVSGRSHAIAIDPTNKDRVFVGTSGGGVWKTENGGSHWEPITEGLPILIGSSLAISKSDSNIVMFGTGDAYGGNGRGQGIFKSTDGGQNWAQQTNFNNPEGYNYAYIGGIHINPNNPDSIVAINLWHIYLSVDGGETYNAKITYDGSNQFKQLISDPTNPMILYASGSAGKVYKTTDGGGTWVAFGQTFGSGRAAIAVSRSNPNVLYISATNDTYFHSLWRSSDKGTTWENTNLSPNGTDYIGQQGWFNNQIYVNPFNADEVYMGGLQLWKSTDAGKTFTRKSSWTLKDYGADYDNETGTASQYIHADFHGMSSFITDETNQTFDFYVVSDGGIVKSSDRCETFTELNNNMFVTQFYSASFSHEAGSQRFVGGTQDNGDIITNNESDWVHSRGGDGGFTEINPQNADQVFTEYVYLDIARSNKGGQWGSYDYVTNGISGAGSSSSGALFIAPFVMDYTQPQTLYAGAGVLYKTTNSGDSWTTASTLTSGGTISNIAIDPNNNQNIWVVTNSGKVYKSASGGSNLSVVTTDANFSNRVISDIAISPFNSSELMITVSSYAFSSDNQKGYVYKSENGGQSWITIDESYSQIPWASARTVVYNPHNENEIFVGTDLGLYSTKDGGTTWEHDTNLPSVAVYDAKIRSSDGLLLVATHGRGVFKTILEKIIDTTPTSFAFGFMQNPAFPSKASLIVKGNKALKDLSGKYIQENETDSTAFTSFTQLNDNDSLFYNSDIKINTNAKLNIRFSASGTTSASPSDTTFTIQTVFNKGEANQMIIDNAHLKIQQGTFDGTAFFVAKTLGVIPISKSNLQETNNYIQIGTPATKPQKPLQLTFNVDEQTAKFGKIFYLNRTSWNAVETTRDGYKLISDIRELGVYRVFLTTEENFLPEEFQMLTNYPNPFNPNTTIEFVLNEKSQVKLTIFNSLGQVVKTLVNHSVQKGRHRYLWNGTNETGAKVASGVYFYQLRQANHVRSNKMILMK